MKKTLLTIPTLFLLLTSFAATVTAANGGNSSAPWATSDPSCEFPPKSYISNVFTALTNGSYDLFIDNVIDDVSWRVMGTHPLAGHYTNKAAFVNSTNVRLSKIQQSGGTTTLVRIIGGCDEEWSVQELVGNATMNNGLPFRNQYSWSTRWNAQGDIIQVVAYVDSALVARVITQNEAITDSDFTTERTVIYDGSY